VVDKIIDIPCVILAGGKSSRMGEDKSLMLFNNNTSMIEYQYEKLSKLFENVYISSKTNKFNFINKSQIILDDQDISSPMVALKTILDTLNESKIFIITVDMPLIRLNTIIKIIKLSCKNNDNITIARETNGNTHNLCGVFSKNTITTIDNLLKKNIHKIKELKYFIKNYKEIEFDTNIQFSNINTKDDFIKVKIYN
jgi:molybdopterin-guanine dinucleotide biosynthesis protein A